MPKIAIASKNRTRSQTEVDRGLKWTDHTLEWIVDMD